MLHKSIWRERQTIYRTQDDLSLVWLKLSSEVLSCPTPDRQNDSNQHDTLFPGPSQRDNLTTFFLSRCFPFFKTPIDAQDVDCYRTKPTYAFCNICLMCLSGWRELRVVVGCTCTRNIYLVSDPETRSGDDLNSSQLPLVILTLAVISSASDVNMEKFVHVW